MSDDWETGFDHYRAERFEEAISYLERAARTPDEQGGGAIRGPALNHLGMAQYVLGRYEEAVTTFRAAVAQTPGKARLHYNLGNSLLGAGQPADAKRQYEIALDLDPEYDEAKQALVVVAAERGKENPAPARIAPPPPVPVLSEGGTDQAPPTEPMELNKSRRRIEALEVQLREAREAVLQTRFLLQKQEQILNDLTEELLALVRAYAVQQEGAIHNAALKHAQTLLSEAASRRNKP